MYPSPRKIIPYAWQNRDRWEIFEDAKLAFFLFLLSLEATIFGSGAPQRVAEIGMIASWAYLTWAITYWYREAYENYTDARIKEMDRLYQEYMDAEKIRRSAAHVPLAGDTYDSEGTP